MKYCFFLLLIVLASCTGTRPSMRLPLAEGYCAPPVFYEYDPVFTPLPSLDAALTPELLARYPRRTMLTANAVGAASGIGTTLIEKKQAQYAFGICIQDGVILITVFKQNLLKKMPLD